MYAKFGNYPQNTVFQNFRVDYKTDLAEYNSDEKFFYSNTTSTIPKNEKKLKEIAGLGNSSVVEYDGLGAYFIDKIDENVWRLEVMPDAILIDNPFGRNSPDKTVGVIKWETHKMKLNLNELGSNFNLEPINDGNTFTSIVNDKSFLIKPGTYIISKKGIHKRWKPNDAFKTNTLKDYYAPNTTVDRPWFKHKSIKEITENKELAISIQFVSEKKPKEILIVGYNSDREYFTIKTESKGKYQYTAKIPSEKVKIGYLNYNIVVKLDDDNSITYPSGNDGNLYDWDFYDRKPYKVSVIPKSNPIYLFDAKDDANLLVREWRKSFKLIPTVNKDEAEYQVNLEKLFYPDNENLNANPIYDYSFKHFIIDKISGRKEDLSSKKHLVFYGSALNNKPCKLQLAFVLDDGSSFGKVIEIGTDLKEYPILISELRPVKTVTLPRPYPTFLPYYLEHQIKSNFDINSIESIQFSIGPSISEDQLEDKHGVGIVKIMLK